MFWTLDNQINDFSFQVFRVQGIQREQPAGGGLKSLLSSGNYFEQDGTCSFIRRETSSLYHTPFITDLFVLGEIQNPSVMGKPPTTVMQVICSPFRGERSQAGSGACRSLASGNRRKREPITAFTGSQHPVGASWHTGLFNSVLILSRTRSVALRKSLNPSEPVSSSVEWRPCSHRWLGGGQEIR